MKAGPGPFMGSCHLVFISALGSGYNFGWLEDTSERHFIGAFQFPFELARRPITSFLYPAVCRVA